jgi:uncharacterized protein (DUF2252 family)
MTPEERRAAGKAARLDAPRSAHAEWKPAPDRADPVAVLRSQDATRLPEYVPIRYGRMSVSPFAFYRGADAVMAADLATTPASRIRVQLCGDAHVSNFGLYASPERTLLFGITDFDETLPGPFEWDVKRLAASIVVAGRDQGFTRAQCREAALAAVRTYRERISAYAEMRDLEVWYAHVSAEDALAEARAVGGVRMRPTERAVAKARTRDNLQALERFTTVVDGRRRIVDSPPLIVHVPAAEAAIEEAVLGAFAAYRRTLEDDRRALVDRYTFVDMALKVVGVGSVGTRCLIGLFQGRDDQDPLFLQVKEAGPSVLEAYLGRSTYRNHAHRVVAGQRLMQAASDIFLGWIEGFDGRCFYWRQLRDMKGSVEVTDVAPRGLVVLAGVCGWALARAHARAGDRLRIAGYLGRCDRFDRAVADFAIAYGDQNERDFQRLLQAIEGGEVRAETGV